MAIPLPMPLEAPVTRADRGWSVSSNVKIWLLANQMGSRNVGVKCSQLLLLCRDEIVVVDMFGGLNRSGNT